MTDRSVDGAKLQTALRGFSLIWELMITRLNGRDTLMDTNGMSFRTFQYLVALDETGHFGDAANRCEVTQSTLSLQIKRLEEYFGVELFDRSVRPVQTTAAGKDIVQLARKAVGIYQQMKQVASSHSSLVGNSRFTSVADCGDFL